MELLQLIEKRTSIRKYQNKPIEQEKLDKILEAMRRAPSAVNRQAWLFYVAVTPEMKERMAEVTQLKWVKDAGAIIAVCGTDCGVMSNGHRADTVDLSIALSFAMLEAEDLGLGTCWIAHYEEPPMRALLGLPEDYSVASIMTVGYADEAPAPRQRKELDEIVRMV